MENEEIMNENNILENWTKDEKFNLLIALKEFGSHDVEEIRTYIPTKTEEQVEAAIDFYRQKAQAHTGSKREKLIKHKSTSAVPSIPLASWAKYIVDAHGFEDLQNEMATALRLIADFEDKQPSICTEKIDFKKVYYMLADALEGKTLPNDKLIKSLLDKCITETALTSKQFIRNTAQKQILESLNIFDRGGNTFLRPTEDIVLSNLRHIISQRNYNPLNIPEEYLKSLRHS